VAPRKQAIDPATVYDANSRELELSYKRAVKEALPSGADPPNKFWRDLAEVVAAFLVAQQNRAGLPDKIKRCQRTDALVTKLGKELRDLRRETPWDSANPMWPNRILAQIWELKEWAEAQIAAYETINEEFFAGKQNAHNEALYIGLLDLWERGLGQKLRTSRRSLAEGKPQQVLGPLVRFFHVCVTPLGITLTANAIDDIVDRQKRRKTKHRKLAKIRRWRFKAKGVFDPRK